MYTVHSGRPQDKRKSLTQIRVRLFQGYGRKIPLQMGSCSGGWSGIRESNPLKRITKQLKTLRFLLEVSIFVSILREKSGHSVYRFYSVSVCDVRINAYHGLVVCPSAELHHLQLRNA